MKPTWGIRFVNERFEGDQLVMRVRFSRLRLIVEVARGMRDGARGKPLLVQLRIAAVLIAVVARLMLRPLAAAAGVALVVAVIAALAGCSARDAIRRNVEPLGLYEVQHPLHGGCHEVGVRAQSATLNRALIVYGGVCVGTIDAGVAGDARAVE